MKQLMVVAAIVVNQEGRILLAQRPPGKALAGYWEFPGGKVEAEESHEAALIRELREELHLEIHILKHLGEFPYQYDWGSLALSTFVVTPTNTPKPTVDVQVFRWVAPEDVKTSELAPADIEPWRSFLAHTRRSTE